MSDVGTLYTGLSEVASNVADLEATIRQQLDELTAAAETLAPAQVYTAVAFHALLLSQGTDLLLKLADSPMLRRDLVEAAVHLGHEVARRELEMVNGNEP